MDIRASLATGLLALSVPAPAYGAERGGTNYLAGYYGDFAVAVQPLPGLYGYATAYLYTAQLKTAQGSPPLDLDGTLGIAGFQYVSPLSLLGAKVAVAGYTTYLGGTLKADTTYGFSADGQGFGDSSVSPIVLYWGFGNLHISAYEAIILPTGSFDAREAVNTSRNYFSFDSVLALTWLDPARGLEVSLVPGLMVNTTNPSTDYHTGAEFHIDGMLNAFVSNYFGIGLHGYYYSQIENDQIAGVAVAGRAQSFALGPAFVVIPAPGQGKVVGKWLHEIDATNRFRGDILSLTGVINF